MPYSRGVLHGRYGRVHELTESLQPSKLIFQANELGPRARVGLCHLPLTVVLVVLVVSAASLWPLSLEGDLVRLGLGCYILLVLACWVAPWERLPPSAPLVIPLGDLVVIGLLHLGTADLLRGLAALAVFPVIWLSVSGMYPWAAACISFVGPFLILTAAAFLQREDTGLRLANAWILPLMLLAVSLAIMSVAGNVARQQRQLEKKDRELRALLQSSNDRERLLGAVLDTVDVGIVAVDARGHTVLANQRMNHLASVVPGRAPGWDAREPILRGQDRKTLLPAAKHPVRRAAHGEEFGDYVVWTGEGPQQRALATAARSMRTREGGFGGAVVAFSDVTSLFEAVAAKDDLVANVSHDLRSPLTSILGNLELVLEVLEDDAEASLRSVDQYLRYAHRSAERLLELVSDLVLSASAATTVHPRPTDLAGLVESCIGSMRPQAHAAKVSVVADVPSPLWTHVDPLRISQVLDNLVSNAIKYSPNGGEVCVTADSDGRETTLRVRDSGLGMSPHDASRAFDKFFRSDAVREAAIPGTGLGLSIAKAIVDRHGGRIECTSILGEGTVVSVALPVEPDLP